MYTKQQPKEFSFKGDPVARLTKALRTPKQMTAIRSITNRLRIDADDECQALLGCKVEELTIWAASALIDWLKSDYFKSAVVIRCVSCKTMMNPHSKGRLCFYCVLDDTLAA